MNDISKLKNNILEAKKQIEKAEQKIKELEKKEEEFKLPAYLLSYDSWYRHICSFVKDINIRHLFFNSKVYAQFKLQYIADKLNDGWIPDWEDEDQEKYYIYHNCCYKMMEISANYKTNEFKIYFKSEKLAEKAIEIMGSDLDLLK